MKKSLLVFILAFFLINTHFILAEGYPSIEIYDLSSYIFSPNNDGIMDNVSIDLKFSEEVSVILNIINSQKDLVKEIYSSNSVTNPHSKLWDGTNEKKKIVPDGNYTIEINFTDSEGNNILDTTHQITIDTNPPEINYEGTLFFQTESLEGTSIEFNASALDSTYGEVSSFCVPSSGSLIGLGNTTISCNSSDPQNNFIERNFEIVVYFESEKSLDLSSNLKEKNGNQQANISDKLKLTGDLGNGGIIEVVIPKDTVIYGPLDWNGTIDAPTLEFTASATPFKQGFNSDVSKIIRVGFSGKNISFSNAVRIIIPGESGKRVGYVSIDGKFEEISASCVDDTQGTNDLLQEGGDCHYDNGKDIVIWTKHLTEFLTYTFSPITQSTDSDSGSGRGISEEFPTRSGPIICLSPSTCPGSVQELSSLDDNSAEISTEEKNSNAAPITGGIIGTLGTGSSILVGVLIVLAVVGAVVFTRKRK